MASPQAPEKFKSSNKVTSYALDDDYTTQIDIDEWVDMRDYEGIFAIATGINGGVVEALKIIGNPESDGSGTDIDIMESADTAGTAEGDYMTVEATAEQFRQEGIDATTAANLRYASVELEMENATDEAVVTYVRFGARFAKSGLTVGVST